ncbi:MAG TPA: AtpZ/AtpI family protein [Candidatus Magasanikbacteria bacterium]|nr:AtpZ/AtpI family protein [Candidatus Magasanikbacteria bacterium]
MANKGISRQTTLLGMRIIGDFGATIAVPVILFVIVGQWLDARYTGGKNYFTIAGFVLAALITARLVYRRAKYYEKAFKEINQKKN